MRLYHGTSERAAERIVKEGLSPRGDRPSVWEAASNAESVYLTDAYAVHFAANATDSSGGRLAILEIDAALLDETSLLADEDALALAWGMGKVDAGPANGWLRTLTVKERAVYFASGLEQWSRDGADWTWSMSVIGNCTYRGSIPPEAITRVALLDRTGQWWIAWHDPVVSPQNYHYMGGYYRATNLVFAGRRDEASEINLGFNPCDLDAMETAVAPRREILHASSMIDDSTRLASFPR